MEGRVGFGGDLRMRFELARRDAGPLRVDGQVRRGAEAGGVVREGVFALRPRCGFGGREGRGVEVEVGVVRHAEGGFVHDFVRVG